MIEVVYYIVYVQENALLGKVQGYNEACRRQGLQEEDHAWFCNMNWIPVIR